MITPAQAIAGFLYPLIVATLFALIGSRFPRGGVWGTLIGLTIGFVLAYHAFTGNWPVAKPTDAVNRTALVAIITGLLAAMLSLKPFPSALRWILAVAAPIAVFTLVFSGIPARNQPTPLWEWVGGCSLAVIILSVSTEMLARRSTTAAAFALGPFAAGVGLVLALSSSANVGMVCIAVAIVILGWFAVSLIDGKFTLAHGPVWACLTPLAGLFAYPALPASEITPVEIALLFIAPLLAWAAELPFIRRWRPWQRNAFRLLLICIPIAIAVTLAAIQFKKTSAAQSDMEM